MERHDYLPFFITEPVFLLKEDRLPTETKTEVAAEPKPKVETVEKPAAVEVSSSSSKTENEAAATEPVALLSKNPIGVVVQHGINEEEKAFIMKVLSAVQLKPTDIDLIEQQVTIEQLAAYEKIIDFGNGLVQQTTKYKITQHQTIKLLVGDRAGEIAQNVELKKKLWTALQELFELK